MCAKRSVAISFFATIAIIIFTSPLVAQVNQTTISGAVRDASGSMVPGARIELLSISNGLQRETTTNAEGIYSFPALPIGNYKLTFSKDGFTPIEIPEVQLSIGQPRTIDVRLEVGNISSTVIVLHHPPYTSSSDAKTYGGGHSARPPEQMLAAYLEEQQTKLRARIVVFAGHVHNYERHEHGGVTYFVCGGGGAHAYPITRASDDPFQSNDVNYHYLLVEVKSRKLKITMHRLDLKDGDPKWTKPDSVTISVPKVAAMKRNSRGSSSLD